MIESAELAQHIGKQKVLIGEGASLGTKLKKGAWAQAIGTSRGGRTSKFHCLADDLGRPVALALTPGNIADIKMAIPLLEVARLQKRLIADKAYDADSLRDWLGKVHIKAVIHRRGTKDALSAGSQSIQA